MTIKLKIILFSLIAIAFFSFPENIFARTGVGVGTGQIIVDQELKSGIIYQLPPVTVLNTGDEDTFYAMEISYKQDQSQLSPSQSWFTFNPETFLLKPGEARKVDVTLKLPLKTTPGNYFAYLEVHPVKKLTAGAASVSIAAAAKLYFKIVPASFFEGVYYRVISFWIRNTPWTNLAAAFIGSLILILIFKKFFNFQIQVKKKN